MNSGSETELPEQKLENICIMDEINLTNDDLSLVRPSPWRWYMLSVFSLCALLQTCNFNAWGPIAESAKCVFEWDDGHIALLPAIGVLSFLLFVHPLTAFVYRFGLRASTLLMSFLIAGSSLQVFPLLINMSTTLGTAFVYLGLLLNGIAGPPAGAGPPVLSAIWFPAEERTRATSIAIMSNLAGFAVSFSFGPNIVQQRPCNSAENRQLQHDDMRTLFLIQAAASILTFLIVFVRFPSKPPHCPSITSDMPRLSYLRSLKTMFKPRFILLSLSFGFVFGGWASINMILETTVHPLGIGQTEAGWLGFTGKVVCIVFGFGYGIVSDKVGPYHHRILVVLMLFSVLFGDLFGLALLQAVHLPTYLIWSLYIGISCCIPASWALYYELGSEDAFPASEGLVGAQLSFSSTTLGGFLLLSRSFLPESFASKFLVWFFIGGTVVAFISILFYRPLYSRLSVDQKK